jgi:hypothetical protein
MQSQSESRSRESAERDSRIAALEPPESIPADKKTHGHVARGDAALAPRKGQVVAQLAERVRGGNGIESFFDMAIVLLT